MNRKGKGTSNPIIQINTAFMQMYRTAKVDMPKEFRSELGQLTSEIKINNEQDT